MVVHTQAPAKATPSSSRGTSQKPSIDDTLYQRNLFMVMALNMTWQLAIVVLVPIVGGYLLDQKLDWSPWLTLVGVAVAAVGIVGVLVRVVRQAAERINNGPGGAL